MLLPPLGFDMTADWPLLQLGQQIKDANKMTANATLMSSIIASGKSPEEMQAMMLDMRVALAVILLAPLIC